MEKRLVYPQYNLKGHRDVYSVTEDRRWLQKTASGYHPEIQEYIKNSKPIPDLVQVLLTALGASETWGNNVNGDAFKEEALKHSGPDYGYKTFLTNANYFNHHINKDPNLAKGKVLASVWNDKMKRVELVVGINPSLDPEAALMLDNGEALCFSMGARLPFDVCTVCGNKAKTRAEYCDHLRYQMNQIDPGTGILVGAINPTPKFFDISRVLIPADKTAYMWEKIAHASGTPLAKVGSAQLAEMTIDQAMKYEPELRKTASVSKSAEITKEIISISHPKVVETLKKALTQVKTALDATSTEIPPEVFRGGPSFNQCIASMAFLGLVPTPRERESLVDLFTGENGPGADGSSSTHPINIALVKKLTSFAAERSFYRPVLLQRLLRLSSTTEKTAAVVGETARASVEAGIGITKGVLQAIGSLFGITGSLAPKAKAIEQMPSGLAGMIAQNPVLAGILAAVLLKTMSSQGKPLTTGNFTVADPSQGMYNNDWQRRFVLMQNRPASVIKTGAAQEQANLLVSPLTYLLMSVDLVKTAEEQRSWEIVADKFLSEIQSQDHKDIVKSASRIASNEMQELSLVVPEIADIEIIKNILRFNGN